MKNLTMRLMIAAAALAAVAVSASAQTYKADVPMAFRAGTTVLEPGSYDFSFIMGESGHPIVAVRNVETHVNILVRPIFGSDAPKAWRKAGNPMLAFECTNRTCSLSKLWTAQDIATYEFHVSKVPAAETAEIHVVSLALTKAD